MSDIYLKPTQPPAPPVKLRARDTHSLLATMDEHGIYLYDRRNGGRTCLLTREQILNFFSSMPAVAAS